MWPKCVALRQQLVRSVLVLLVLTLCTPLFAQGQGTTGLSPDQLLTAAYTAYNNRDWLQAALRFSAYMDRNPARLQSDPNRKKNVDTCLGYAIERLQDGLDSVERLRDCNQAFMSCQSHLNECLRCGEECMTRGEFSEPRTPLAPTPMPVPASGAGMPPPCFLIAYEDATWDAAKRAAERLGGHLATIASQSENSQAYQLVAADDSLWYIDPYNNGIGPWIGGYQPAGSPEPGGGWRWVTGEAFNYTNWAPGEPNNSGDAGESADLDERVVVDLHPVAADIRAVAAVAASVHVEVVVHPVV